MLRARLARWLCRLRLGFHQRHWQRMWSGETPWFCTRCEEGRQS